MYPSEGYEAPFIKAEGYKTLIETDGGIIHAVKKNVNECMEAWTRAEKGYAGIIVDTNTIELDETEE